MLKIGIDGNLLCGKRTGMGTVVYNVLPFWKSDNNCQFILYVPEELEIEYSRKLLENGIIIKVLGSANYFKWEQIALPGAIKKDKVDVLWCPYNTAPVRASCKFVVTINDVIYMTVPIGSAPSLYKKMGIIYRRTIVPIAARNASKIITISEFAKREIESTLKKGKGKTKVVYLGADFSGNYLSDDQKAEFFKENGITSPFILGFGSLEARKNSFSLIQAYEGLPVGIRDKFQLVLFGFRGFEGSEQYQYIKDHGLKSIVLLGYVSDEEKNTLYKNAEVFVFPSLSEGFGIPVLEAYANGTAVITSNTSSLPEVAGDAALYVNPSKQNDLIDAVSKLLEDEELREELLRKASIQLGKFNWEQTAMQIRGVLCED